jgi:hypothetical protein
MAPGVADGESFFCLPVFHPESDVADSASGKRGSSGREKPPGVLQAFPEHLAEILVQDVALFQEIPNLGGHENPQILPGAFGDFRRAKKAAAEIFPVLPSSGEPRSFRRNLGGKEKLQEVEGFSSRFRQAFPAHGAVGKKGMAAFPKPSADTLRGNFGIGEGLETSVAAAAGGFPAEIRFFEGLADFTENLPRRFPPQGLFPGSAGIVESQGMRVRCSPGKILFEKKFPKGNSGGFGKELPKNLVTG